MPDLPEQFVFFYGEVFSQWYPSVFALDGLRYNCAEQYMMAEKARMFGDATALLHIVASSNPAEQKGWGRRVRGFDETRWNGVAREIVYRGNHAKFTQNPELLIELLRTAGKLLVEASGVDRIWGIGLWADDPRARDRSQWRGSNWLGEVLTRLREDLIIMLADRRNGGDP